WIHHLGSHDRGCDGLVVLSVSPAGEGEMRKLVILALTPLSLGACNFAVPDIEEVPENPTFTRDILPLFEDHCLLCHGNPPSRGAPHDVRLDVYEFTDTHEHHLEELDQRRDAHAGHD